MVGRPSTIQDNKSAMDFLLVRESISKTLCVMTVGTNRSSIRRHANNRPKGMQLNNCEKVLDQNRTCIEMNEEPKFSSHDRSLQRAVERTVDVLVPQMVVEELVEVFRDFFPGQGSTALRVADCRTSTHQERISERIVEQIVDVLALQIVEDIVQVVKNDTTEANLGEGLRTERGSPRSTRRRADYRSPQDLKSRPNLAASSNRVGVWTLARDSVKDCGGRICITARVPLNANESCVKSCRNSTDSRTSPRAFEMACASAP